MQLVCGEGTIKEHSSPNRPAVLPLELRFWDKLTTELTTID